MNEYISREEAIETIRYGVCRGHGNKEQRCELGSCAECGIVEIINDISRIEAADVQPVKHGRWVVSDTQKHVEVTYECSECQHEVVGEYEKTPFCGGCGARMDGDKDNNVRNLTNEETAIYESWIESEAKDTGVNIMDGDGE